MTAKLREGSYVWTTYNGAVHIAQVVSVGHKNARLVFATNAGKIAGHDRPMDKLQLVRWDTVLQKLGRHCSKQEKEIAKRIFDAGNNGEKMQKDKAFQV